MPSTHNHTCKHCDQHWSCANGCQFPYDVSKWHDCGERQQYLRMLKRLMADYPKCPRGCTVLPCQHDKWADKPTPRRSYNPDQQEPQYYRPRMRQVAGKWIVLDEHCNEATVNGEVKRIEQVVAERLEWTDVMDTTGYVNDGKARDSRKAQKQWLDIKKEQHLDSFPQHLQGLIKESRGWK